MVSGSRDTPRDCHRVCSSVLVKCTHNHHRRSHKGCPGFQFLFHLIYLLFLHSPFYVFCISPVPIKQPVPEQGSVFSLKTRSRFRNRGLDPAVIGTLAHALMQPVDQSNKVINRQLCHALNIRYIRRHITALKENRADIVILIEQHLRALKYFLSCQAIVKP